jgi:stringent starvation protein B
MLSNKPYLIRAYYQWIIDNDWTPYIAINTLFRQCNVPTQFIENDQITLNITPALVRDLKLGNDKIEFQASFAGTVQIVSVPVKSVLAIYGEESQEGMFFDHEEEDITLALLPASDNDNIDNLSQATTKKGPNLRLVD